MATLQGIKIIATYRIKQVKKVKYVLVVGYQLWAKTFTEIFTPETKAVELEFINKIKTSYQS